MEGSSPEVKIVSLFRLDHSKSGTDMFFEKS
jgi:hypothetical protein